MIHFDIAITPVELPVARLPAALEGLRVAHLTDLHVGRRRGRYDRIIHHMRQVRADLIFLTGDYMTWAGDEPVAMDVMAELCPHLDARLGVFGVFGNHDSTTFRRLAVSLPVRWLNDAVVRLPDLPLDVMGLESGQNWPGDSLALLRAASEAPDAGASPQGDSRRLRLLLSHYPTFLPTAADMGVDVMFSGHTHGGQCRLPLSRAIYNSTDLPMHLSAGILRHRRTLAVVSRGLGETLLPLRVFCPAHIPVYTLRSGGEPGHDEHHLVNTVPW